MYKNLLLLFSILISGNAITAENNFIGIYSVDTKENISLHDSVDTIFQKLGEPNTITEHLYGSVKVTRARYDGLIVSYIESPINKIDDLIIMNDKFLLFNGLTVGVTETEIITIMGEPTYRDGGSSLGLYLGYRLRNPSGTRVAQNLWVQVDIFFDNDVASQITMKYDR